MPVPDDHTAPPTPDSDAMLVQRTLAGEQRAFDLLVLRYQRRVERLIGRMVRDVDLVQDIAQETFVRAYRALAQFRGDAQFYTGSTESRSTRPRSSCWNSSAIRWSSNRSCSLPRTMKLPRQNVN